MGENIFEKPCVVFEIKSNQITFIVTAQVPWWVKFLRACSRQCKKQQQFTYGQYIFTDKESYLQIRPSVFHFVRLRPRIFISVHPYPNIYILSLIIHPHVIPNPYNI